MGYFRFSVQRLVEKKRFLEEKLKKETRKEQIKQIESKIIELDKTQEYKSQMAAIEKEVLTSMAINKALEDVANKDTGEVPMHIRNAPVEGMEKEGYHVGYKYPHDYPGHYVEQQYLPDEMLGTKYYIKDDTVD